MTIISQISSQIVPFPRDVASAGVNPAPAPSGDTADAISSLPPRLDSVSVTSAASAVLRGAAAFSFDLAGQSLVGERERRLIPERLPACSVGVLRGADGSAFKAINSRNISSIDRAHRVLRHAPTIANLPCDSERSNGERDDSGNSDHFKHFHHSVSVTGVNTA